MNYLIMNVNSNAEWNGDCDIAIIELTPKYIQELRQMNDRYLSINVNDDICDLRFWDSTPEYYSNSGTLEETLTEEEYQIFEDNDWIIISNPAISLLLEKDRERTETDLISLSGKSSMQWTAYVKHTDIKVYTPYISWEVLQETEE